MWAEFEWENKVSVETPLLKNAYYVICIQQKIFKKL